jgi:lipoyl synthase
MNNETRGKRRIDPHKPKIKLPGGKSYLEVKDIVSAHGLNTICQQGNCPNIAECWGQGTATFMILGDICTRSCRFCSVKTGKPAMPMPDEPTRVARSVQLMKLRHCVITSVDRDDLHDGGSGHWNRVITEVKRLNPGITMEVLIPDFRVDNDSLDQIIASGADIISHNLETVERLTPQVRVFARYRNSLSVLKYLADRGCTTKSGIMLGLGETKEEILQTLSDLVDINCNIVTIGQYLQPTPEQLPVIRYYSPDEYDEIRRQALALGFRHVESGALVRSSYHAEKHI